MSAIVPAILSTSREDIERKAAVLLGKVDTVQIDVVDGTFAEPPTWPYVGGEGEGLYNAESPLPYLGRLHYEIDLMVAQPETIVGDWIAAGANRIVFHAESSPSLLKTMQEVNLRYGHDKDFAPDLLSLGIALNIESDVALLTPFLEFADYVQFMGIANIGKQGQPFDDRVLRKIAQFRSQHPDVFIQVDGGISVDTAHALLSVGVDRLVVGSAIWRAENLKEAIELLKDIVREHNG